MRGFAFAGALLALLPIAPAAIPEGVRAPSSDERLLLDSGLYYRDGASERRTSHVRVSLVAAGDRARLRLRISPLGALVDAPPGYEGIRGANRVTAEELELVLELRPELITRSASASDGSGELRGSSRVSERGPIPVRELRPDGRLDLTALSRRRYPLAVDLETAPLPVGDSITELRILGELRLRIGIAVSGSETAITSFESLSEGIDLSATSAHVPQLLPSSQDPARPAIELPLEGWDELDLDGRWVRYRTHAEAVPEATRAWVEQLSARREYELLEWIGLSVPFALSRDGVLSALEKAEAPQWIRLAIWRLSEFDVTSSGELRAALTAHPELVLEWLALHPGVVRGPVAELERRLKESLLAGPPPPPPGPSERKAADYLPPIDPAEVLRLLDPPAEIAEFGDRSRAEPGVVYRHQVERAISVFVLAGMRSEDHREQLGRLFRHADARLRIAAILAQTHLPPAEVPSRELLLLAERSEEPLAVREAAYLAHTYGPHPEIYLRLLEHALDPAYPLRRVAASRLVDLDEGFALPRIDRFLAEHTELDDGVLREGRGRIDTRLRDPELLRDTSIPVRWLERAAWARGKQLAIAAELGEWTLPRLRATESASPVSPELLAWLESEYVAPLADPAERELLGREIRALVGELRGGAPQSPERERDDSPKE